MQCLYCGSTLALWRGMTDGPYCSGGHRLEHSAGRDATEYLFPLKLPGPHQTRARPVEPPLALAMKNSLQKPEAVWQAGQGSRNLHEAGLVPWSSIPPAAELAAGMIELRLKVSRSGLSMPAVAFAPFTRGSGWNNAQSGLQRLAGFAMNHWKVIASLASVILAAYFDPAWTGIGAQKQAVTHLGSISMLSNLRNSLQERAAVQYTDDFRSGLDRWQSSTSRASAWTYDATGFVRPSALAVYRPTMALKDYQLEFLGEIEQKGLGVAYRVMDWTHYYAMKLIVVRNGASPVLELVRYTVQDGREVGRVTRELPFRGLGTTLQRIHLNVNGSHFTLRLQGRIADDWSDGRYASGGVGFFCGRGEQTKLRWVQVSHQYDTWGRFCALLAPAQSQVGDGKWGQP